MPTGTSPPIESKRSRPVSQHTALKFLMYVGVTGYQIVLPDCVASRAGVEPAAQGACGKRNHHFLSPSYACPEPVLVYHQLVFDFQIYILKKKALRKNKQACSHLRDSSMKRDFSSVADTCGILSGRVVHVKPTDGWTHLHPHV